MSKLGRGRKGIEWENGWYGWKGRVGEGEKGMSRRRGGCPRARGG